MAQRSSRRDSIVQERDEEKGIATLTQTWEEKREEIIEGRKAAGIYADADAHAEPESPPRFAFPTPRFIDPLDLSEFKTLTEVAKAARERLIGLQQSVQEAQTVALKTEGAWEGELLRLRRRYGLAENEGFDSETGEIRIVQG